MGTCGVMDTQEADEPPGLPAAPDATVGKAARLLPDATRSCTQLPAWLKPHGNLFAVPSVRIHPILALWVYPAGSVGAVALNDSKPAAVVPFQMTQIE